MAVHYLQVDRTWPEECRHGAVTIGNFDGMHRGHQEILSILRRHAGSLSGPAVTVTFDPHPMQLLRPEDFQPVLTTIAYRTELLRYHGADQVVVLVTTPELLQLGARDFFDLVLRNRLDARGLVEGPNFHFGHDRKGDVPLLQDMCREHGMTLEIPGPVLWEGKIVSSSGVRQELVRGAVRTAADLLGRPFRLSGTVARGQNRGKSLGFPTANLEGIQTLIPGDGVYAVRVHYQDKTWPGAANIGPNPTFGEQACKVEVHLIDFQGDLYGRTLAVDFTDRLRDTRTFANAQELTEQLRRDVEQAKVLF